MTLTPEQIDTIIDGYERAKQNGDFTTWLSIYRDDFLTALEMAKGNVCNKWMRGQGQTTEAVRLAKKLDAYIVVRNRDMATRLSQKNPTIRFPVTFHELLSTRMKGSFVRDIVIDDVDDFREYLFLHFTSGLSVSLPTPPKDDV